MLAKLTVKIVEQNELIQHQKGRLEILADEIKSPAQKGCKERIEFLEHEIKNQHDIINKLKGSKK